MKSIALKSIATLLFSVTLSIGMAGQSSPKKAVPDPVGGETSGSQHVENASGVANSAAYRIGPTDVLKIEVWKEPSVSGSVTVRPDGKVSLPLINDIQAAGLTPMKLARNIAASLKKYIADPNVTVIVDAANSRRIYVVGEVNHPGPVSLLPNATVLDALASAGGPAQFANRKKIFILRNEDGKQVRYDFNYQRAIRGDLSQDIALQPGDTIVVP